MIEQLSELVNSAGVSRMNLSIQSQGNEHVNVVIQAVLGREPDSASDKQKQLRAALSTPINVSGYVGEVDVHLEDLLYKYIGDTKSPLNELKTNVEEVVNKVKKANTGVNEESNAVVKAEQSDPAIDDISSDIDALTTGEADSL